MTSNQILSNIIGGLGTAVLIGIATMLWRSYRKFNRFMAEHIWLITTTLWTRDKVIRIMSTLDMPMDDLPPSDLPKGRLNV